MSDTPTLAQALVAAQADMPALQRDKINPAFRSKYLSLEALLAEVLPVLNRHGLAVSQWPSFTASPDGTEFVSTLETMLVHGPSGETWKGSMLLLPSKRDAQGQGAAITYAKRYALTALCGLSADEDDDGNTASAQRGRTAASSAAAPVISDTQRRRLRAIQQESGVSDATLKQMVKQIAGVDSSTQIPRDKYEALVSAVQAEKAKEAA